MHGLLFAIVVTGIIVLWVAISRARLEAKMDGLRLAVTAERLGAAYAADAARAQRFYGRTRMVVRGSVQSIHKDSGDRPYLMLEQAVRAEFTNGHSALAALAPGDHVVVACSGANLKMGSVVLRDCFLEK